MSKISLKNILKKTFKKKNSKKAKKKVKKMKKGGAVKKHRGDGCVIKGRTKGRMV